MAGAVCRAVAGPVVIEVKALDPWPGENGSAMLLARLSHSATHTATTQGGQFRNGATGSVVNRRLTTVAAYSTRLFIGAPPVPCAPSRKKITVWGAAGAIAQDKPRTYFRLKAESVVFCSWSVDCGLGAGGASVTGVTHLRSRVVWSWEGVEDRCCIGVARALLMGLLAVAVVEEGAVGAIGGLVGGCCTAGPSARWRCVVVVWVSSTGASGSSGHCRTLRGRRTCASGLPDRFPRGGSGCSRSSRGGM